MLPEDPRITAVVLYYNAPKLIRQTLRAIQASSIPVLHTIVVDNGSSPPLRQAELPDSNTTLLSLPNTGVGRGHNKGWHYALQQFDPDFIWALEHDTFPAPDCLEKLMDAYRRFSKNEAVAAIGPIQDNGLQYDRYQFYLLRPGGLFPLKDPRRAAPYFGIMTFNGTLIPASTLGEVGFLREDFFLGHEDFEYCRRIWRTGKKILRFPPAIVFHDQLKSKKRLRIGKKVLLLPQQQVSREYYSTRNSLVLQMEDGISKSKLVLNFLNSFIWIMLFKPQKYRRLAARWTAYRDALEKNLGKKDYWFLRDA